MRIVIEIEAKFGSKFREKYGPKTLDLVLQAWAMSEKNFNKKTEIKVTTKGYKS